MIEFYSHTLVRNGQPFIGLVLRQVLPYAEQCLVTVSIKSDDGTIEALEELLVEFPDKIVLEFEDVEKPAELTQYRQKQLDITPDGKWILFLDSNDYWPTYILEKMTNWLRWDMDGLAINPYQIVDREHHDASWENRWFTKWFKKQKGVHYRKPWPRDLIFKDDVQLYWRVNKRVPKIKPKFFHLDNLMPWRFRDQAGFEEYKTSIGKLESYPEEVKGEVFKIFDYIK